MRIAIIDPQGFANAAPAALLARATTVAGVFCAPGKPGAKPDPLRRSAGACAASVGLTVHTLPPG